MKDIDNKIDIILRQKLLMGYNPSMNLNENVSIVKNSINSKEKLDEVAMIPAPVLAAQVAGGGGVTAGALGSSLLIPGVGLAIAGGIAGAFLIANFVQGFGRRGPRERISFFCQYCKDRVKPQNIDSGKIARIANQLYKAYRQQGFLGTGLGTNEEGAYDAFRKLKNFEEFCSLVQVFEARFNRRLYDYIKNEHWRTQELMKIMNIIDPLYLRFVNDTIEDVAPCLINLIRRRTNNPNFSASTPFPSGGINIPADEQMRNPTLKAGGGIKIISLIPNPSTRINWRTQDSRIKGYTECAQNGCVVFVALDGTRYFIDQCYRGGGDRQRNRTCPNGFTAPQDGIYKICTTGQPVVDMQKCLGINQDGKFGTTTLNALRTQKGVDRFTVAQLATLCQTQPPPPPPVIDDNPFEGNDISLNEF